MNEVPLYGHTSAETAYLVADYPYGLRERCRIRYWIEAHPRRGFRFVSQTEHPRTLRWNKPKASTYARIAACMYLDKESHVTWACLTEYSGAAEVAAFALRFPGADLDVARAFAVGKAAYCRATAAGKAWITVNGANVTTDADREEASKDAAAWLSIVRRES